MQGGRQRRAFGLVGWLFQRASQRPVRIVEAATTATTTNNDNRRYFSSGFDTIVENQIKAWQENQGHNSSPNNDNDNKGTTNHQRKSDHQQRHVANALGVGDDYLHSKILADNNIKPESIQRRIEMDHGWHTLRGEIQAAYHKIKQQQEETAHKMSPTDFSHNPLARDLFATRIQELDEKAKKVNEAIISDSLRFNGRSPVPHARRFRLQERIQEALEEEEEQLT